MRIRQFQQLAMASGLAAILLSGLSGCQAWNGATFPFQNPTRVPPAGTGSYATPGGYYNNTSAVTPSNQLLQASSTSGGPAPASFGQAGGSMPASNFVDPAVRPANFVTPSFATAPTVNSSRPMGTTLSDSDEGNYSASASLNDFDTSDAPSLEWRQ